MQSKTRQKFNLSRDQSRQVLQLLNIPFRDGEKWLMCACPVHQGDNPLGFGFNLDTCSWTCFTHHCEHEHGRTILGLISSILSLSEPEAVEWVQSHIEELSIITPRKEIYAFKIYPETCLRRLFRTDYYRSKGFGDETLEHFEHGAAESSVMRGRCVFPIRNDKGQIIGFSGRWMGAEKEISGKMKCVHHDKEVPKWRHTSFPKSQILYNFNNAKNYCKKEVIVVESIGNAMRWYDAGFKNVVAVLGSSVSTEQCKKMIAVTPRIILAFDNDVAGRKAATTSYKRLEELVNVKMLLPPDHRDWAQLSNEELKVIYGKI